MPLSSTQNRSHPVVLIVDDDEDCRIMYSIALEAAGYTVLLAADGETGVRSVIEDAPDVVLMDVAMPRMDGRAALRAIRADPARARTPVIAITALESINTRGTLEDDGFDAVLLKPVLPAFVVTAVRLAQSITRPAAPLTRVSDASYPSRGRENTPPESAPAI